jgi:hypothetical protein
VEGSSAFSIGQTWRMTPPCAGGASSRFLAQKGMGITIAWAWMWRNVSRSSVREVEAPRFITIERRWERGRWRSLVAMVAHTGDPDLPMCSGIIHFARLCRDMAHSGMTTRSRGRLSALARGSSSYWNRTHLRPPAGTPGSGTEFWRCACLRRKAGNLSSCCWTHRCDESDIFTNPQIQRALKVAD